MEYNKYYLFVQALRAQGVKNKDIKRLTGLNTSSISKLLHNKQTSISKKSTDKFYKTINELKRGDKILVKSNYIVMDFLKRKDNSYNVMRLSRKLSKSKTQDVFQHMQKELKKFRNKQAKKIKDRIRDFADKYLSEAGEIEAI